MAETDVGSPGASGEPQTPPRQSAEDLADMVVEIPQKYTGKQRLLLRLQRISSSPTLAQLGRPRSSSAPYRGRGSLSCVSLAECSSSQQSNPGSYFPRHSAAALSETGPTTPGSPLGDTSAHSGIESVLAVRKVETLGAMPSTAPIASQSNLVVRRTRFDLWLRLPHEIKVHVLSFFQPKELIRVARVNKEFHKMCFDGQLWTCFDASEFYKDIPAESLAKIIVAAGPFVKDLNLRGCVQVEHYKRAEVVVKACRNLINATLEGCRNFQRTTLHNLLKSNAKLAKLNLTGLTAVTNTTCRIISQSCPQLEMFNVSWCKHMDAKGIKFVVEGCPRLKDLRAGEIKGFDNRDVAEALFRTNNLERLVLAGCDDLNDQALRIMVHGVNPEVDILTERPLVPPRKLRHLDLSRCSRLTTPGVKALGDFLPDLEGLQLAGCSALTDAALEPILATTPRLTLLDVEDLNDLTNALLSEHLAKAPCAPNLEHLSISYCESLGDAGVLPVIRKCTRLRNVELDNTRISDLVLAEAAAMVRNRSGRTTDRRSRPYVGLSMVVYDCQNVTWPGVREVLSRNAEIKMPAARLVAQKDASSPMPCTPVSTLSDARPASGSSSVSAGIAEAVQTPASIPTYPTEIISLKCFYGWQMTVDEHTKRVLRGDLAAASRLERKWADYMQANEEAGVTGSGGRRRRRRAREAQQVHADEEEGGAGGFLGRRRARTTACVVM